MFEDSLYAIGKRYRFRRVVIEDLISEATEKALACGIESRPQVYRIMINLCINRYRKERRHPEVLFCEIDIPTYNEMRKKQPHWTDDPETKLELERILDGLSPEMRHIVGELAEGKPMIEIARGMGCSHTYVKSKVCRMREKLSKNYGNFS